MPSACRLLPERAPPRTSVSTGPSGGPLLRRLEPQRETWTEDTHHGTERDPEDEVGHRRRHDEAMMEVGGNRRFVTGGLRCTDDMRCDDQRDAQQGERPV